MSFITSFSISFLFLVHMCLFSFVIIEVYARRNCYLDEVSKRSKTPRNPLSGVGVLMLKCVPAFVVAMIIVCHLAKIILCH